MIDFKSLLSPWMIIDGHYILHRSLRTPDLSEMKSSKGFPTGGVFGFLSSVKKSLEKNPGVRKVIVCWDTGRSGRRKEILPSYKDNRKPSNEKEEREKKEFEKSFRLQRDLLWKNLTNFGIRQVALPQREGDDLIGLICQVYNIQRKLIISEDKDLLQLINGYTSIFRPFAEEIVNEDNFQSYTGALDRSRFIVSKAILGDSSDNIPGINGVGKITIQDLLGTVNEMGPEPGVGTESAVKLFIEAAKSKPRTKKGTIKVKYSNLIDGYEGILRNIELIDLSKEEFSDEEKEAVKFYVNGGNVRFNKGKIMELFVDLEFKSMIKHFSVFDDLFGLLS